MPKLLGQVHHYQGVMFTDLRLLRLDDKEDWTEDEDQDEDQGQYGHPDLDEDEQDSDDPAGHRHRDAGTRDGYDDHEGPEMESAGLEKVDETNSSSSSSHSSSSSSTSRGSMARAPSPKGTIWGPSEMLTSLSSRDGSH
ncbi:zinc finger Ran-binding domain-containing protein 2-like [Hypomesus transpacificus]|uniref:zinc finger Ran-binding domain-containing protein 2-like n=1 Tax=Hypomesus transpacificus TaxID=137520 RepID=UPI001F082EA9|nr:zinc finger Ran-binding domain-containing protein 2-like [Hypomesus transpacificus]